MLVPVLYSWIKQTYSNLANWIDAIQLVVFVIVAAATSQCQIFKNRFSSQRLGVDMLNVVWLDSNFFLAPAVFATSPRTISDRLLKLG